MGVGRMIRGYLAVILSAVLYGCMPLMAKLIYADGVNQFTLVFLRNFLALPVIGLMAYMQNKTLKIPKKMVPKVCLTSLLGSCITPILLYTSYKFIDGGTATVFHFIYPAIVVIISIILREEKVRWGNVISVVLCVLGICLFYEPGAALDWRGAVPAVASGFTYAAYVVLLSRCGAKQVPGFLFAFYVAVTCSISMLIICLTTGQLALPQTAVGWGWSFLFSIGITCGAVVLFQLGTFIVGGQQAAILSALEPITSVIISVVMAEAVFGLRTGMGTTFVIGATILIAVCNIKKTPEK